MVAFVSIALSVSAALVIGTGVAKVDAISTGCTDLLLAADLVEPLETVEEPSAQDAPQLNQPVMEDTASYRMDLYGPGDEDILYIGGPNHGVIAGDGDDRIFVFEAEAPGLVVAEGGGDTVIFCSLGAPYSGLTLNSSIVSSDSEPDTLIIGPDVFRRASRFGNSMIDWGGRKEEIDGARIQIAGFDPRTDRIVLRPPWPVEVRRVQHNAFDQRIYAGPLELVFSFYEEALDPLHAVSVSQAPDEETVAALDLAALLASRNEHSKNGIAGGVAQEHEENSSGSLFDDHDDGHGGDNGHGMGLDSLVDARATATRCGDFFAPSTLDAAVQDPTPEAFDAREATWRDGADTLAYFGDGVPQYLMAGGGDDLIWLFDVEEGTEIIAGKGSDLVILCSVDDISATVWLESGDDGLDDEPDTLVVASRVLEDIPEGFQRTVSLYEYDPLVDRLVLPPSPWSPVIEMNGAALSQDDAKERVAHFHANVIYGPIRVDLNLGQSTNPAMLYQSVSIANVDPRAHIQNLAARRAAMVASASKLRPVDLSTWGQARTLAGATVTSAPPTYDCITPPDATVRPPQPALDEHDALRVEYSDSNDIIIVRSIDENPKTGFLSQSVVYSGAGTDVIYSFTSNASLVDGPGSDTTVICDMDGLATSIVAPPDDSPDTLIVDAAVFRKPVSQGFERRLSISGYGEPGDVIILRMPDNARIEPYLSAHYKVVTPQSTTQLNLNGYMSSAPGARPDPTSLILWPE
jgi:hypothetical protein